MTIKIPSGGYTDVHNNTGFDLDLSCVTNRIRSSTVTQGSSSSIQNQNQYYDINPNCNNSNSKNNYNNNNDNIMNANSSIKSTSLKSSKKKNSPDDYKNEIININTRKNKQINKDKDSDDYSDIYTISTPLNTNFALDEELEEENVISFSDSERNLPTKREEEHVYNKANMDKWNFNYNIPSTSAANHNGNGYRSSNLDNPKKIVKKK